MQNSRQLFFIRVFTGVLLSELVDQEQKNANGKGGSYGNKILYKNLNFFDKIFVPSKIS